MADPYIGEIRMFGFNFAPIGWALCNGQTVAIEQNVALFSILGTTYGGDGQTTFALPDMRSRTPISFGQGSGLAGRSIGEIGGEENVTLTQSQLPLHNHLVKATTAAATTGTPTVGPPATIFATPAKVPVYRSAAPNLTLDASSIAAAPTDGGHPHANIQPYLAINFCISLFGVFPSRN